MNEEHGSATIEMIIWLPVLLVLLGAVVQFGLYFNAETAVQAASFEAARQASIAADPAQAAEDVAYGFADSTLPGWHKGERVAVVIEAPDNPKPGDDIDVRVTYQVPGFLTGIVPGISSSAKGLVVYGSAKMSIEERP